MSFDIKRALVVVIGLVLITLAPACRDAPDPGHTNPQLITKPATAIRGVSPVAPSGSSRGSSQTVDCTLDQMQSTVSCKASGVKQGSRLHWTSNVTSRSGGGARFEFKLEQNIAEIQVDLETCLSGSCTTETITISNNLASSKGDYISEGAGKLQGRNIFHLPFDAFPFSCTEFGDTDFTSAFFPPDLLVAIEPMGKMAAMHSHVTPTDHLYAHRKFSAGDEYILAPADGFIVKIGRFSEDQPLNSADEHGNYLGDKAGPLVPDYRVVIMHSCSLFTIFIHVGEFASSVTESTGEIQKGTNWMAGLENAPIPVKAGEPIAKFGSDSLDWSVHDTNVVLEGFVVPEHYDSELWKIHTVDPFQFYTEPARTKLLSKVVRKVEPRSGKIDYDIEGMIVGNWFLDGTVNYAGAGQPEFDRQQGHLSIAYGSVDPSQIRISIGGDTGIDEDLCGICAGAYGVRGNHPDPATVNIDTGLVKYELMSRDEDSRFVREQVGDISIGTFLVQHLGDRSIRVEVIPGKTPTEVSGFSDASKIYRR